MKSLKEVWLAADKKLDIKVRWNRWDYHYKFFQITGFLKESNSLQGKLCTGEEMTYSLDSLDWDIYTPGDEDTIRAI